ncbi:4Fe-4S binding protein [Pseudodesulfovibrio sp. JC047]|uniref:4Fe-4S binding protein n=1 Tax=Pseudodesulfovibrio sp. JC047 TaxID=2683199 RepID=UPI0013D35008|nr:4Fe-4S binding protein [Pseudodesulfovibrio sp. JC047]NDV19684.1 4Fe-4S binding protein [Pseudodesulfovibrio sp. JC047]
MKQRITPTTFRLTVQAAFTLFCAYVGFRFAAFMAWALGTSQIFVPKPGAVEGFLPISALMGFRQFLHSGTWDTVHPAGLAIFIAILLMAVLFRKGFCGYICPVGFISHLLELAGRRLHLAITPPKWINFPLMGLKYLLLGGFCYAIFSMTPQALESFISSPYNRVSDAKMLAFFTNPSALSLSILGGLLVLSLCIRNFWCRYLCPYGALLGLLAWFSPVAVKRDTTQCIHCEKCTDHCPSGITIHQKTVVHSPECLGCAQCIEACPVEDCLSMGLPGGKRIPWLTVGIGAVATLLLVWAWAKATGHWDSTMSPAMLKRIYMMILGA